MWSDPERLMVDYLASHVGDFPATVGTALPSTWTPASPAHLAVALDYDTAYTAWGGTETRQRATMRVTAWAGDPTTVKRLASRARTALLAFPARPNTGLIVTRDPDNLAPIASFTAHISVPRESA